MSGIVDRISLRDRAVAAHRAAVEASELQRDNEQAVKRAKYVLGLVNAWAEVGVVVCPRELKEQTSVDLYFEREGYRLGWASPSFHGIDEGSLLIFNDAYSRWEFAGDNLEHIGAVMTSIDNDRAGHRQGVLHWSAENQAQHLVNGCSICGTDIQPVGAAL